MNANQKPLPRNWIMSTIGGLYDVTGGGTPSTSEKSYWNGRTPWITSADINGIRSISVNRFVSDNGIENSTTNRVPRRTLLVVTRVGLGKIAISDREICFSQDVQGLVAPATMILPEYALYYLSAELQRLKYDGRGTTISGLTKKQLKDTTFPLAPFSEQRRIVAKIEELFSELDKGVEALTTAREQLKAYRQSVLKHAFEGNLTEVWRKSNPQGVAERLLADVQAERKKRVKRTELITSDAHDTSLNPQVTDTWTIEQLGNLNVDVFDGPFGSNLKTSDYVDRGVRVIRLENIGHGHFIDEKQSFVSEEKYRNIQKHTVVPGDIVFSSFVTEAVRSALVPAHIQFAVNKADCFGIRFFGNTVNPKFVQFFFQSRSVYKQIEGMIHGVGRPRINTTQLKGIEVPLCSPAEQAIITEKLESTFSEVGALEATIEIAFAQLAALRQSILKQAFSGQLVAQDPADEPASVLLDRIRREREAERRKSASAKPGRKPKESRIAVAR